MNGSWFHKWKDRTISLLSWRWDPFSWMGMGGRLGCFVMTVMGFIKEGLMFSWWIIWVRLTFMNMLIATILVAFNLFQSRFLPIIGAFFSFQLIYSSFLTFKLFAFKHFYSINHNSFSAFHRTCFFSLFPAFHSSVLS